jgi:hypothetical protein
VVKRTQEEGTENLKPGLKAWEKVIPDGYLLDKGGTLKKRSLWGAPNIKNPLREEEFRAIESNP